MKTSKLGKALGLLTALVLSTAGLTVMSAAPASAGTLTGATLRLINHVGFDVTQSATDQGWAQYYNAGLKFQKLEATRGSLTTLTYEVKDQDGNALGSTAVGLRVAKDYSGSNANLSWIEADPLLSGAHAIGAGIASTKGQQATIAGVTDADGIVSFMFSNTDTTGGAYPAPVGSAPVDKLYTQTAPMVMGMNDMDQAYDLVNINYTKLDPSSATLRLVGSDVNAQNSYDATQSATDQGWAQYYNAGLKFLKKQVSVGSTISMKYLVKDQDGDAVPNHAVQLRLAKQYSNSNAGLSVSFGANAAVTGKSDQIVVDGTTDADGFVTFSVQNTDSSGGAEPVASDVAPVDTLFTQTAPLLVGLDEMAQAYDLVNLNYTSSPVVDPCVAEPALPGCTPPTGPTAATLRLVGIDETNSYDGTHYAAEQGWAQYYNAGLAWKKVQADLDSTTMLDYLVLDQDGNPVVGKEVQLRVAKNYSGSNAHVSVTNGIDAASEATGQQVIVSGMTSETGHVVFAVNGLDTSGAGARVAPTAEAKDTLYTQIAPLLVGLDEMAQGFDLLNINYVAGDISSSDVTVSAMTVNGSAVATDGTAVVHVAAGTTSVAVVATTTDANASAVVTGDTALVAGDNTVTVEVTAQDGTTKASYTVKVVVDPVVAPAVKVAISSAKGKVSVKFTNAKGKTVRIYISGSKSVTKKITSNSQTLTFSVKKGKKTVSASVAGKNFTKSVTVK